MEQFNTLEMIRIVEIMTDTILANEVAFCDLDSAAGDGDFGMSLAKGFREIKKQWNDFPKDDFGLFLKSCGLVITEYCGGASGPIWGAAFRGAAKTAGEMSCFGVKELAELLQSAVDSIQKIGGAKQGDKTLLDALIPAALSLKASAEEGVALRVAVRKSAQEATFGAEQTKYIVATRGRASYVGERSLQFPDAGAAAIGIIFTQIANDMLHCKNNI